MDHRAATLLLLATLAIPELAQAITFSSVSGSCEMDVGEADGLTVHPTSGNLWVASGELGEATFSPGASCGFAFQSTGAIAVGALGNGNLLLSAFDNDPTGGGLVVAEFQVPGGPAPSIDLDLAASRLTVHRMRGTFFAETTANVVTEYDFSGTPLGSFGIAFDLQGMTVDPVTQNLFLSNGDALSVEEFTPEGSFVTSHDLSALLLAVQPDLMQDELEALAFDPSSRALYIGTDGGAIHRLVPESGPALLILSGLLGFVSGPGRVAARISKRP